MKNPFAEITPFFKRANVSEEIQNFTQALIENLLIHEKEVDDLLKKISSLEKKDYVGKLDEEISQKLKVSSFVSLQVLPWAPIIIQLLFT